jgi:hypothetical protein
LIKDYVNGTLKPKVTDPQKKVAPLPDNDAGAQTRVRMGQPT